MKIPRKIIKKKTSLSRNNPKKKVFKPVLILSIFLAAFGFFYISIDKVKSTFEGKIGSSGPAPFPFQDMTIPFLRSKNYESGLGSIEPISENSYYSSYITHYNSEGLKINGLLTKPSGEMPKGGWPAIVFVHGYIPPGQYSTTGEAYSTYVDYLARSGFVVFKIDFRGHGDSEGEAGGGYFGSDYIADTLNAYSAVGKSGFVNPEKIGLWGHSMAGNALLRSVAVEPEIPAVSIWAGAVYSYTDREKYGINDASFQMSSLNPQRQRRRREMIARYGEPSDKSPFWKMVAPTNYLNDFKGAVQLNHALDDNVVDIGYSRDLDKVLDKTSVPHEFHEYESGGHDIAGTSFVEAMNRTVEFFNKYLKAN